MKYEGRFLEHYKGLLVHKRMREENGGEGPSEPDEPQYQRVSKRPKTEPARISQSPPPSSAGPGTGSAPHRPSSGGPRPPSAPKPNGMKVKVSKPRPKPSTAMYYSKPLLFSNGRSGPETSYQMGRPKRQVRA